MSARKVGETEPQPEEGGSAQLPQSIRASKSAEDSDKKVVNLLLFVLNILLNSYFFFPNFCVRSTKSLKILNIYYFHAPSCILFLFIYILVH